MFDLRQSLTVSGRQASGTQRSGIGLVELLLVIAIVALLVAIAIPALLNSRSSARWLHCRNNLKQYALASLNFEASRQRFPPGSVGYKDALHDSDFRLDQGPTSWRNRTFSSFQVVLLPYMEQQSLADPVSPAFFSVTRSLEDFRRTGVSATWYGELDGFASLVSANVPYSKCPDDHFADQVPLFFSSQPVNVHDEDLMDGLMSFDDPFAPLNLTTMSATNYGACSGAHSGGVWHDPLRDAFRGSMASGEKITVSAMGDGLSNTILFGETIGKVDSSHPTNPDRLRLGWAVGGLCRMRADVPWMSDLGGLVNRSNLLLGNAKFSFTVGFGSKHNSGVNFAYADGAVETMHFDSDWKVLYRMSGIDDSRTEF